MPPEKHALLSASSASRWLKCTAAPRFEEHLPERTSEYAEEGRLAHAICELKTLKKFTVMTSRTYTTRLNKLKKDPLYSEEMDKTSDLYIEHLIEQAMLYDSTPTVAAEVQVDFGEYVPEGFGTCDNVMIGGDTLSITDYKHGKGVPVSAVGNPQMRLYALGALKRYAPVFGDAIKKIRMSIDQPRLDSYTTDTITVEELLAWGESMYQNDAMKVLTGEVRLSYANLTTSRAAQQGGEPKYSVTLLIPKSDAATKADIDAAIQAAANDALTKVWNGARPPMLKVPIYDGDGVRPSGVPFGDECKGHWVMTASTKNKPQVVGIDNINCELSPADIYSGMYGRVTVRFFGYSNSGNKGIGCGLGNVLKTRDGEPLSGQASAASDFAGLGAAPAATPSYGAAMPATPGAYGVQPAAPRRSCRSGALGHPRRHQPHHWPAHVIGGHHAPSQH